MRFLLLVTIPDPEAAKPHLTGHRAFLEGEFAKGRFLTYGPIFPLGSAGFILADYESEEALAEAIARDPLVISKTASYESRQIVIGKNQLEKME